MKSSSEPQDLVEVMETKPTTNNNNETFLSVSTKWISLHWKRLAAEFGATVCLVFFGCLSCIPIDGITEQSTLYTPFGFGLAVMISIQIFGHVSGALMNPVVTTAALIYGSIPLSVGIGYMFVEFFGALTGYGLVVLVSPMDVIGEGICVATPHPSLTDIQVLAVEAILAATLCFICCSYWDPVNDLNQSTVCITFGLAVAGMSIAANPLTGAASNPFRAFAPRLYTGIWEGYWMYFVGPFLGSIFAATSYKLILFKGPINTN